METSHVVAGVVMGAGMSLGLYTAQSFSVEECERMFPYVLERIPPTSAQGLPSSRFGFGMVFTFPSQGTERITIDYTLVAEGKTHWTKGIIEGQMADYHWFCIRVDSDRDRAFARMSLEAFNNPPPNYDLRNYLSPEGVFCGLEKLLPHTTEL